MLGVMAWAEMEKSQAISDVMTVTDEAFIHLVIRNYEDRWTMMAERTQYHQPLVRKCLLHVYVHRHVNTYHTANLTSCQPKTTAGYIDEDGEIWLPLPDTVYTNQAQPITPDATSKVPYNGWSNKGLLEFNRVCETIKEERIAFPNYDSQYLAWATQFHMQRASKRKRREVVAVYNELDAFVSVASLQPPLED